MGSPPNGRSFVVDATNQGALTTEVTTIFACEGVGAITKQETKVQTDASRAASGCVYGYKVRVIPSAGETRGAADTCAELNITSVIC